MQIVNKSFSKAWNGGMESFAKHCLTYGTIVYDNSYVDGSNRECRDYQIDIQGVRAEITKRTGEVIAVSYDEASYA